MPASELQIGPATVEETARGLRLAWGHIAEPVREQHITRTLAQWRDSADPSAILLVARRGGEVVGGGWAQTQPGRTAILSPPHLASGEPAATADRMLEAMLRAAGEAGAHLAQVLLEVDHGPDYDRLLGQGFHHLTDLLYLVSLASSFPDAEPATRLELESYAENQAPRMAALVEQTYEATRDCPAMNGMREMTDVLAGYRAAGTFDPGRWFFLRSRGGTSAACCWPTIPSTSSGNWSTSAWWPRFAAGVWASKRFATRNSSPAERAPNACCWGSTRTTSRRSPSTARRALPPGIGGAFWCA